MSDKDSPGLRELVDGVLRSFDMFREDRDSGKDAETEDQDYVETGMLTLGNTVVPDPKCKICMQGIDHLLIIDGYTTKKLAERLIGTILGVDPLTIVTCPTAKQMGHMVSKCEDFDWNEEDMELHGQWIIDDLRRL